MSKEHFFTRPKHGAQALYLGGLSFESVRALTPVFLARTVLVVAFNTIRYS
jgi:hypothetical protein